MTWGELDLWCKGYEIRLARSRELDRLIATILINVNRGKNSAVTYPEDILPLITDKKKTVNLMSKEEFEVIKKEVEARYGGEKANS